MSPLRREYERGGKALTVAARFRAATALAREINATPCANPKCGHPFSEHSAAYGNGRRCYFPRAHYDKSVKACRCKEFVDPADAPALDFSAASDA